MNLIVSLLPQKLDLNHLQLKYFLLGGGGASSPRWVKPMQSRDLNSSSRKLSSFLVPTYSEVMFPTLSCLLICLDRLMRG